MAIRSAEDELSESFKLCEYCGRRLPLNYAGDYCQPCQDYLLLSNVKDFIRENDVNEYQVAEHFHIPLKMVKSWIREGRIEYREQPQQKVIKNLHCQICGAPVAFGSLCQKCLKQQNTKGYQVHNPDAVGDDNKMRFLDIEDFKKSKK